MGLQLGCCKEKPDGLLLHSIKQGESNMKA